MHESAPRGRRLERFGQQQMGFRRLETKSSQTLWWRKTDSNPRSLSGEEGDRTTPSLASNDFHRSKYPNGQSKTAEAAVVKQQFDSVWARADTALTASAFF